MTLFQVKHAEQQQPRIEQERAAKEEEVAVLRRQLKETTVDSDGMRRGLLAAHYFVLCKSAPLCTWSGRRARILELEREGALLGQQLRQVHTSPSGRLVWISKKGFRKELVSVLCFIGSGVKKKKLSPSGK